MLFTRVCLTEHLTSRGTELHCIQNFHKSSKMFILKVSALLLTLSSLVTARFDCLPGWPSETHRYGPPPGWEKEGDPIPPGWRYGDELPMKRDVENLTMINLSDFEVPRLNLTETVYSATSKGLALDSEWERTRECCHFTWDCMTFYKSGHWKLDSHAENDDEKKSWCCVGNYRGSCKHPQRGEVFDFNWPPKCSNPWYNPE